MGNDLVFLHAPSVYDFRRKPIFYGPVSDVIPSSPVFEMYPIGFMTIAAHLAAAGFRTRIVNVAVQMLQSDSFDAEECIRRLDADVFAIDLHWMPHAHGALELARIVKRHHPDAKVEIGGFTASYFKDELIRRPEVDLVMCGDTTEEPTVRMMEALQRGGDLSEVPNLVWKDADGRVRDNGVTYVLDDLDSIIFDYGTVVKGVLRNMDMKGALPWLGWDRLPLASVFTVRGCSVGCAECGGSRHANGPVACRSRPAFRSPAKLAEDMDMIQSYFDTPIFIVGDLRQAGGAYAEEFLRECRERRVRNHVVVELFNGAGPDYFTELDRTFEGGWSIEFSPDSHDEAVRNALGKTYTNEAIERTIPTAFDCGCGRFDLFYMNGLPYQDRESAMDSVRASKRLWASVGRDDGLFIYNAPFAPFVDPGSRIFESPEEWGYVLRARTLEDHRRLLDSPSWKHVLSYETRWMTRDEIAEVSYDAAVELASCEFGAGRISEEDYKSRVERAEGARGLMHRIDRILEIQDPEEREARLWETKDEGVRMMNSTIANKRDLDWDAGSVWSNSPRIAWGLAKSLFRRRPAHHPRLGDRRVYRGDHGRAEPHVLGGADPLDGRAPGGADLVLEVVRVPARLQDHLGRPEHGLRGEPEGVLAAEAVEHARVGHRVEHHVQEGRRASGQPGDGVHFVLGHLDRQADGPEHGRDRLLLLGGDRVVDREAHGALQDGHAMVRHDPHYFGSWHIRFQLGDREPRDEAQDDGALPQPHALLLEDDGHLLGLHGEDDDRGRVGDLGGRLEHPDPPRPGDPLAGLRARRAGYDLVVPENSLREEAGYQGVAHPARPDEADAGGHARVSEGLFLMVRRMLAKHLKIGGSFKYEGKPHPLTYFILPTPARVQCL